jgi:hypothetical protein
VESRLLERSESSDIKEKPQDSKGVQIIKEAVSRD